MIRLLVFLLCIFPFYVKGLGSFNVGLGLYNIALPLLVLLAFKIKKQTLIIFIIATLYLLLITDLSSNYLKVLNFCFSLLFVLLILSREKELKVQEVNIIFGLVHFIVFINVILYFIDLSLLNNHIFCVDDKSWLGIPRMKGYFLEPSHLGIFIAIPLLRKSFLSLSWTLLFVALILTQSYFGLVLFFLLKYRIVRFASFLIICYFLAGYTPEFFITNSGLVRMFGMGYILSNLNTISFLGNGIGFGQTFFGEMGQNLFGISEFNGFLGDVILDLGLIGLLIFYVLFRKVLGMSSLEIFFLIVLLLNVGFAVGLLAVSMLLFSLLKYEENPVLV